MATNNDSASLLITNVTGYEFNNVVGTTQQTVKPITHNICPVTIPFSIDTVISIPDPGIQINYNNGRFNVSVNNYEWIVEDTLNRQNTFILNYGTLLSVILVLDCDFKLISSIDPGDLGGGIAMVGTVSMIVAK